MFTVGRVGTYIVQGVYTFSGPFHPFGGAVDIIVVQQEDGTFKSSPWYVKFGKFQGVLKRRENKVIVAVNDVDADFHMYLDHKGEAYFLKDDVKDEALLEIEDSPGVSTIEAASSSGENSAGVLAIEDGKADDGQDTKADIEKEESEDERADDIELKFEGREASKQLRDERAAAAKLELALTGRTDVQVDLADVIGFPQVPGPSSIVELASLNSEYGSFADICRIDVGTETGGKVIHTLNPALDSETSQDSSESSAFIEYGSLGALTGASLTKVGTKDEIQDSDRESSSGSGRVIHALLNQAVGLQEHASSGSSTALMASATLNSLARVVSDTESTAKSRDTCAEPKLVELSEEDFALEKEVRGGVLSVSEGCEANRTDELSSTHVKERSYADVCGTVVETETTNGTEIHALLNQAVGVEVSESSSQASVYVANAALEALTAASLPEIRTSAEIQVSDWESSSLAGKVVHRWLNKAIGLPETARSGPASALVAKAVLTSFSRVVSDTQSTPSISQNSAEPKLVELSRDDVAAEKDGKNVAPSSEEASSSVVEIGEASGSTPVSAEVATDDKLVVVVGGRTYPWTVAAPVVLGILAFGQGRMSRATEGTVPVEQPVVAADGKPAGTLTATSSGGWKFGLWPFGRNTKPPEQVNAAVAAAALIPREPESLILAADAAINSRITKEILRRNGFYKKPRKVRTNSPSSQQLASLGLKEGSNKITFTFFTRVLGKQQVDARIFLWKWNTRVVISDVDGTITKSDVLGQVMPLVGKDWTQTGVAKLFSSIKKNGYELMFLSARAISQAYLTRQFLENIKQDGEVLPDGPVVISPDGLFPSLYREVIRRAPHEFKIACLEDIKSLFPPESKPFYAGFGNRDTDELSYLKVGISKGKIFIINPKGEVVVNNQVGVKSYTSMHKLVDDMFPAMTFTEQEDFNEWNFWKIPLPDIEEEEGNVKSVDPCGHNFLVNYDQKWFEGRSIGSSSSRRSSKGDRHS